MCVVYYIIWISGDKKILAEGKKTKRLSFLFLNRITVHTFITKLYIVKIYDIDKCMREHYYSILRSLVELPACSNSKYFQTGRIEFDIYKLIL